MKITFEEAAKIHRIFTSNICGLNYVDYSFNRRSVLRGIENSVNTVETYKSLFYDYYTFQRSYLLEPNRHHRSGNYIKDSGKLYFMDFEGLNVAVSLKYQGIDIIHELRYCWADNGQEDFLTFKLHKMIKASELKDEDYVMYLIHSFIKCNFKASTKEDLLALGYEWYWCVDL